VTAGAAPQSGSAALLPLFPLRTVLFPGGLLPLRIFEPRYVDLVGRCMREASGFGVVQIVDGAETGALASLAAVGTSARIVDFEQLPDGLLGVMCRGERRFRLLERSAQADGLHLGAVDWLDNAHGPIPERHQPLVAVLRRVVPQLGSLQQHLQADYADADWVSNRFADLMPLDSATRQQLLETDSAVARLDILAPMIRTG
jgi:Lon protease-like protein